MNIEYAKSYWLCQRIANKIWHYILKIKVEHMEIGLEWLAAAQWTIYWTEIYFFLTLSGFNMINDNLEKKNR